MLESPEAKREIKAQKIFFGVAKFAGVTVGLFLLMLIAPFIHDNEATSEMQDLFMKYGLFMLGYIGIMTGTYLFMRNSIFMVNSFMQFMVLPSFVIMFLYDAYTIMTE